jgi:cellulose synthase/poly-beta-1,6-N-acetylglucosamine synthase-like glycosyltransferase
MFRANPTGTLGGEQPETAGDDHGAGRALQRTLQPAEPVGALPLTTNASSDLHVAPDGVYDYDKYSQVTGPFQKVPESGYIVEYVSLLNREGNFLRSVFLIVGASLLELVYLVWLLLPSHWPVHEQGVITWKFRVSMVLVISIGMIELFRLISVAILAYSTLNAKDPVPVRPARGSRVAFLTSIVPGKEPIEMAEATLHAARQMSVPGVEIDCWLLDEGDVDEVKAMCERIGAKHFSRRGIEKWNQPVGAFKLKTKHGNYNSWLTAHGDDYDFWVSVDTDHVPMLNFVERLLGYFRDPDVAFVIGPQVYGNYDNFVTRAAESQQFVFHSVMQRAANTHSYAMFVGTNNAMRISALKQIGGLADSITEDAVTSMVMHSSRNPDTGRRWKSVYTPDVLAVGEGPSSWNDFFSQQYRWSRGGIEVVLKNYWMLRKLGLRRRYHYFLLMSFYPMAALAWLVGMLNLLGYLVLGAGSIIVSGQLWMTLYVDAAILQFSIYFWNRRNNVSPHEESGSSGAVGMFISALCAPVYAAALFNGIRRRIGSFVVTPKGADASADTVSTFKNNLGWAVLVTVMLIMSQFMHHTAIPMRIWAVVTLVVSMLPIAIWKTGGWVSSIKARRRTRHEVVVDLRDFRVATVDSSIPSSEITEKATS